MEKPIMKVKGSGGQVELWPDKIRITRKGFWNILQSAGYCADLEIQISSITSIRI